MKRNKSVFFISEAQQNFTHTALKDEVIEINLQSLINFNIDNISESDYNLNDSSVSICKPELSLLFNSALKSVLNNVKKIIKLLNQLLINNVCRCNEMKH